MLLDLGRATNVTETVLSIADEASDELFCLWAKLLVWWEVEVALSANSHVTLALLCASGKLYMASVKSRSNVKRHSHKHCQHAWRAVVSWKDVCILTSHVASALARMSRSAQLTRVFPDVESLLW